MAIATTSALSASALFAATGTLGWTIRRWRNWEGRHFPRGRATPGGYRLSPSLAGEPLVPRSASTWLLPPVASGQSALVNFVGRAVTRRPRFVVSRGSVETTHHLPDGWSGSWALDLTPPPGADAAVPGVLTAFNVEVVAAPLHSVSGERPRPGESVLILAPHPDDAELAAFGLYTSLADRTWIVTLTAGEHGTGWRSDESAAATHARAAKRMAESVDVPEMAGVPRERCRNLLLPDSALSDLLANPSHEHLLPYARTELGAAEPYATGDGMVRAFRDLLQEIRPAIVVCPDPTRDQHLDHRATAPALALALRGIESPSVRAIYLYVIHAVYSDIAPFGPTHGPGDPPPPLREIPLSAFYAHKLDAATRQRKLEALTLCSDVPAVRALEGPLDRWRDSWLPPRDASSLVRRCVRQSEWFRSQTREEFLKLMPAPTVSILIPAYNAEPWIGKCVESALAQTHPPLEVLVWNDGSTDRTADVLKQFGDRIRVFEAPNMGGNRVRNRLLAQARGDWVQFLDADDALLPDKIERQLREAAPIDNLDVIYSPTIDEIWGEHSRVDVINRTIDVSHDLYSQWFGWELSQANGSLWRRSSIERIGGWKEGQPCCQDNELYGRALREGLRFGLAPTARSLHRTWPTHSVSTRDPLQVVRERTRLLDEMVAWLRARGRLRPEHLATVSRAFFEMARTWARYDLDAAAAFVREREARGEFRVTGPAAPITYAVVYRIFGFRAAERLARALR